MVVARDLVSASACSSSTEASVASDGEGGACEDERGPRGATSVAAQAVHVVSPQLMVPAGEDRVPVGREG